MKLSVRDINKTFVNNRVHTKVLEDISMDIDDGQFVCLLGPSGCGKTTLLTIIGGFQKSERGDVFINDKRVKKPGIDRAFIFQNYALFHWKTIRGNVLFPMKQQKIPKEKREEMLEELLVMSDLKGKEKLFPHQLSGGMKQRVAMIRALACNPEVLLMDEPLGAVDFQMRQNLQEELERIWIKKKITALMVTHDVDEAVYMSDRVIVMSRDKGRIIDDINIDIPRPRIRGSQKYEEYKNKLTDTLSKCYEV
ncbi:TPA: ABC transporter ATP-binding protein [Clostridioides difficile]|uniref:ABC transporter ATP-binding protein SaoA n=1 Tax=Clostridioides difficile TaxID=1496 RepID=UPI0003B2A521|nr:ABC transporter ATP-binding protein SaoA [Clostridioides difficile]CCL11452.1 ABC-type transport system,nitrate/sulfonate/taurine ATP-binding protein [Clostridioides difficile E16]CCL95974.1 ABC-type transport system,nitrate/sulfonate/taurine ATP-binding protein [Clostridioides difficile T61]VFC60931.1 aliphatic sulfonate ABC transporter ATP-binding protein [Clostridioides difficile]VHY78921.1 aliphatic sulfonate ABC transporter ATP-binding protein [Clostridioides difficile]HBE8936387.1 ABC